MSPPKYPPSRPLSDRTLILYSRKGDNESKPCSLKGCPKSRRGLSPYCVTHASRVAAYGTADGASAHPRFYKVETSIVRDFFHRNAEHKAVLAAGQFFSDWLRGASLGDKVPGMKEFAHLSENGVTGTSCLESATALYLFSRWHPEKLPGGVRLIFALALAVLRVAPPKRVGVGWKEKGYRGKGVRQFAYRWIPTTARRAIGEQIIGHLGAFFVNVVVAIEQEEEAANETRKALATGFTTTGGNPPTGAHAPTTTKET